MPASSSALAGGGKGDGGAGVGGAGVGAASDGLGASVAPIGPASPGPSPRCRSRPDPVERDREVEQHVVERVLVGRVARRVECRDELAAEAVHRGERASQLVEPEHAAVALLAHEGADEASHRALGSLQSHGGALAPQAQPRAVGAVAHPAEVGLDRRLAYVQLVGCRVHVEPVGRIDEIADEACEPRGGGALGGRGGGLRDVRGPRRAIEPVAVRPGLDEHPAAVVRTGDVAADRAGRDVEPGGEDGRGRPAVVGAREYLRESLPLVWHVAPVMIGSRPAASSGGR